MASVKTLWNKYKIEVLPSNSNVITGIVESVI